MGFFFGNKRKHERGDLTPDVDQTCGEQGESPSDDSAVDQTNALMTELAEHLLKIMDALGVPGRFDHEQQRIVYNRNGEDNFLFLGNIIHDYRKKDESERHEFLVGVAQIPLGENQGEDLEGWDQVKTRLLPRVREGSYYHLANMSLELRGEGNGFMPNVRPFAEHYCEELVIDLPHATRSTNTDDLERWGVSLDQALVIARKNLREISDGDWTELRSGVFATPWKDNYDSSRLLLTETVRGLPLAGNPVAVAPARDHVYVAGSDDADALQAMMELAIQAYQEEGRPYCLYPIELGEDGDWRTCQLAPKHPFAQQLDQWKLQANATEYSIQQDLLNQLHEKKEVDIFVGSFSALETPRGIRSYSVLSQGIVSLLPRSDLIILFYPDAGDTDLVMEWDQFNAAFPGVLKPVGMIPERYMCELVPSLEDVQAAGATGMDRWAEQTEG